MVPGVTLWPPDELAWARECLLAGDTPEEVAAIARRTVDDVRRARGPLTKFTDLQRQILSLYAAGLTFAEIDAARGFVGARAGKAAGATITFLRRRGFPIPHRISRAA